MQTKRLAIKTARTIGGITVLTSAFIYALWPGYVLSQSISLHDVEHASGISGQFEEITHFIDRNALLDDLAVAQAAAAGNSDAKPDLGKMVLQAEPYMAKELHLKYINRPRIKIGNTNQNKSANYRLFDGREFNYINVSRISMDDVLTAKVVSVHESIHAQILAKPYHELVYNLLISWGQRSSVLNESYTEVATFEILADQANSGDAIAEAALLYCIYDAANKPESERVNAASTSLHAFINAALGKQKKFYNLELDGVYRFANRLVKETRASPDYYKQLEIRKKLKN
jgi:hypothetical protein